MKYYTTKNGQIIDENNQLIPMDESSPLYQEYYNYLVNDGTVYQSDYEFPSDIKQELINKALAIDLDYTNQISELLKKHIEKLNLDSIPIPQNAIDERLRLRAECNQKITDLGITDFNYRKTKLSL
jgi:hypothetical protein